MNETEFATGDAYADFIFVVLIALTLHYLLQKRYAFIKTLSVYEKTLSNSRPLECDGNAQDERKEPPMLLTSFLSG